MTRDEKITRLAALVTARWPSVALVAPFTFMTDGIPYQYARINAANGVCYTWQVLDFPGSSVLVDGRGRLAPPGAKPDEVPEGGIIGYRRFPCFRQDADEQLDVLIECEEALARDNTPA